jgi:hypothetical protein
MTIADLARRASKLAIDNSPTILTTFGVVGTITTAYLVGKASFEASDVIRLKEAADEERGIVIGNPREVIKDRVKLVWRLYIPSATMGVAAVACIIGANRVGSRRAAGLAAAYSISEKAFDQYKQKVVEKIGERKEEQVRDEIMQERVNESYTPGMEIYGLESGELCYDKFSDRYFKNTVEGIRSAENDLNFALIHDGYASLAEFYQFLGLPSPAYSEGVGWNSDRKLEVRISTMMAHGEKPCLSMDFKNEPTPDYGRFR